MEPDFLPFLDDKIPFLMISSFTLYEITDTLYGDIKQKLNEDYWSSIEYVCKHLVSCQTCVALFYSAILIYSHLIHPCTYLIYIC